MSTKKDKYSSKDKNFMRIAFNLAIARKGLTGNNPSVGCVIVKNDKIISVGQTGYDGRPHAETNAIAKLARSSESGDGCIAFITHQPCLDCAKLLYQAGVKEVYYAHEYRLNDGVTFLEKCGIHVEQMAL